MFGGEGSSEGTWTYDPWQNTWTQKKPPKEPEGRSGGNMAYDVRHKVHVLFGSQFDDDQHTWIYDLNANIWTELATDGLPPTKQNDAVLTYDSIAGVLLARAQIGLPLDEARRMGQRYYDLTADEVRAAFAKWIRPQDFVQVVRGPQ